MSRSLRTLALSAAITLLAAPAARAQDVAASAVAPRPAAAMTATTLSSVAVVPVAAQRAELRAATQSDAAAQAGVAVQQQAGRGDGKVYMIVGGVAFLAGAVIDGSAGDIVMISGAVVGLYGLYLYLR